MNQNLKISGSQAMKSFAQEFSDGLIMNVIFAVVRL